MRIRIEWEKERGLTSLLSNQNQNQNSDIADEWEPEHIEEHREEGIPEEDNPEDMLVGDIPVVDKHPWDILPVDNLLFNHKKKKNQIHQMTRSIHS